MATEKNLPTFEIGLVLAGAVSAGAYSAGVLDYLFESLEEWDKNETNKKYNLKIRVLTGASAGGICAGITAWNIWRKASGALAGNDGLLKKTWVEDVDMSSLLLDKDLKASWSNLNSLLDSTIITEVAEGIFREIPSAKKWDLPNYVHEKLDLFISLSNLRGVPFELDMGGESGYKYGMVDHKDYQHISINQNTSDEDWEKVKNACMGTSAFPFGLAPRIITRKGSEYDDMMNADGRKYSRHISLDEKINKKTLPKKNSVAKDQTYSFITVDGGLLNNEPLELARAVLHQKYVADKNSSGENTSSEKKHDLIFLIDPFPNTVPETKSPAIGDMGLGSIFLKVFSALRNQALFKTEEIYNAADGTNYKTFLIAPVRYNATGTRADFPIASGFFGGFGGFLAKDFREHDYYLGRRNCQRFLQRELVIGNDAEDASSKEFYNYLSDEKDDAYDDNNVRYRSIIPQRGAVKGNEQKLKSWPTYSNEQLKELEKGIKFRLNKILHRTMGLSARTNLILNIIFIVLLSALLASEYFMHCYSLNDLYIPVFQIIITFLLSLILIYRIGFMFAKNTMQSKAMKMIKDQLREYNFTFTEKGNK